jgi:hypothetical protein
LFGCATQSVSKKIDGLQSQPARGRTIVVPSGDGMADWIAMGYQAERQQTWPRRSSISVTTGQGLPFWLDWIAA